MRALTITVLLAAALGAAPASAQVRPGAAIAAGADTLALTLNDAVSRALATSEDVESARTQRDLAEAQITQARAGAYPQVSGGLVYNRTLASIFDNIQFGPEPEPGEDEEPNPFAALPFGQRNTWTGSIQIAQPLYSGGRVGTALAIARNVRAAADYQVEEAQADIALQVRQAYFQLVLAEEMVGIAREAFALADVTLRQVALFRQQGTASEFDVLRAQVERDNLEPGIVEAQNARRLAELNLKRLTHIPAEQPIAPATPLEPVLAELDRDALRDCAGDPARTPGAGPADRGPGGRGAHCAVGPAADGWRGGQLRMAGVSGEPASVRHGLAAGLERNAPGVHPHLRRFPNPRPHRAGAGGASPDGAAA
jgi:outer membrane protein TolC